MILFKKRENIALRLNPCVSRQMFLCAHRRKYLRTRCTAGFISSPSAWKTLLGPIHSFQQLIPAEEKDNKLTFESKHQEEPKLFPFIVTAGNLPHFLLFGMSGYFKRSCTSCSSEGKCECLLSDWLFSLQHTDNICTKIQSCTSPPARCIHFRWSTDITYLIIFLSLQISAGPCWHQKQTIWPQQINTAERLNWVMENSRWSINCQKRFNSKAKCWYLSHQCELYLYIYMWMYLEKCYHLHLMATHQ